jgi:hypothetical protein
VTDARGAVVTKLTASGDKDITYVPAMGLALPAQTHQFDSTQPQVTWDHQDPVGLTEAGLALASYDPLGNYVQHSPPQAPAPFVAPLVAVSTNDGI